MREQLEGSTRLYDRGGSDREHFTSICGDMMMMRVELVHLDERMDSQSHGHALHGDALVVHTLAWA